MDDPKPLGLEEIVRAFLELAMVHPEKAPRTQRAGRDNQMTIIGFNRAQETLRKLLTVYGDNDAVRELADVRAKGQERPLKGLGGVDLWVAS